MVKTDAAWHWHLTALKRRLDALDGVRDLVEQSLTGDVDLSYDTHVRDSETDADLVVGATAAIPTLWRLNLAGNHFGPRAIARLVLGVPHWRGLHALNLSDNAVADDAACVLFDALAGLPTLRGLGLARNRIQGSAFLFLHSALTRLDVRDNPLAFAALCVLVRVSCVPAIVVNRRVAERVRGVLSVDEFARLECST